MSQTGYGLGNVHSPNVFFPTSHSIIFSFNADPSAQKVSRLGIHTTCGIIAVVLLIFGILIITLYPANAEESSEYTTIVLMENEEYWVGDNATLEIRFFNRDNHQDAHEINLTLGDPMEDGRYLAFNATDFRISKGIYQLSFPIEESDTTGGEKIIAGIARCTFEDSRGEKGDSTDFVIPLKGEDVLVEISADKPRFQAGDVVTFSMLTTLDGNAFTPDTFISTLTINGKSEEVTLVEDDVGSYHYDYLDPDDSIGKVLVLEIEAIYDDWSYQTTTQAMLQFYQLWVDVESETSTTISAIMGICDPYGDAVSADVELWYYFENGSGQEISGYRMMTTDQLGVGDFNLDISGIGAHVREVVVDIWVNGSDSRDVHHRQFVTDTISFAGPASETGEGFAVIYQKNQDPLPLQSTVSLSFRAYNNGSPLINTKIFHYSYTGANGRAVSGSPTTSPDTMLSVGNVTTDGDGFFTLSIDTPADVTFLKAMFKLENQDSRFGEGEWVEHNIQPIPLGSSLNLVTDMEIGISNFGLGKHAILEITGTGHIQGKGTIAITPVVIQISEEGLQRLLYGTNTLGWRRIGDLAMEFEEHYSEEGFIREMGIPSFLPGNTYFLILVTSLDTQQGSDPLVRDYRVVDNQGNEVDPFKKQLEIIPSIPDSIEANNSVAISVQIITDRNIPNALVTLETTDELETCKPHAFTDDGGVVSCALTSNNISGGNLNGTIWINATKEGFNPAYFTKSILIIAWTPPKDMQITTDLPDIVDSGESRPMNFYVTSGGKPVSDVRVTIEAEGSASTCKKVGITNEEGKISCVLSAHYVLDTNGKVILHLNGTRSGYNNFYYAKEITIKAANSPDEILGPIQYEFGNGIRAVIIGSIVGNVDLQVLEAVSPDLNDSRSLGVYLDIEKTGEGTLRWLNITFGYTTVPDGLEEEKLRLFYWDAYLKMWKLAKDSGVDMKNRIIYANVTHVTIFAPREIDDITPPFINHKAVTRAQPNESITIKATITDDENGVKSAILYYRQLGNSVYMILTMVKEGDEYSAVIPAHDVKEDKSIEYYIRATDGRNTAIHPKDSESTHVIKIEEKEDGGGFIGGFQGAIILTAMLVSFALYLANPNTMTQNTIPRKKK